MTLNQKRCKRFNRILKLCIDIRISCFLSFMKVIICNIEWSIFNKLKSGGQTLVTKVKETAVEAKDMASELTQQNPADATKPNAKKRYCMECGAEIPVQAKFCQECGANQQ